MHNNSLRPARRPRSVRLLAGVAVTAAATLLTPTASYAEPEDEEVSLEELNEQADELEDEYAGDLIQYEDAKENAKKAKKALKKADSDLAKARDDVSDIAAAQYKSSGVDPVMEVVLSRKPGGMLDDAAVVNQIAQTHTGRLDTLSDLKKKREKASKKAAKELKDAKKVIDGLKEQRDEIKKRIEKYKEERVPKPPSDDSSAGGGGTGTVPAGARGWGFDGATPRMAAIRDEIIGKFGAPYPVGCQRSSNDDHGSGQACDFMMSAGGNYPSSANQQKGQQIAEYAKNNAGRLGVKYVIWEQKIWDSRNPGAGWKPMNDRGSVTQNHYDHVHVSSF
ncbi:hypothetical protein CDO52_23500 [Nocardiopsis gilva YIM 90087]|uniref:ARB-07466-like C-terminal domain-containing protein n=1 Tax=Nocardiopsis gilva YIM 90087 TaxID=1235441 RepID=A0A223SBA4_9ACTN|nr:hypothetical protein [Nocardiopsis gilva]ASU85366.1 hypothetical protein CDO52_23500 [Nocardiopsis gilva YIM 90087]